MACEKVRYKTSKEAIKALNDCKELKRFFYFRSEDRIYWCRECRAYHLTKQKKRKK